MSVETDAARAGATVLYVADGMGEAQAVLDAASADDRGDIASVRRTNGRQRITYNTGGRIIFVSPRTKGHRGVSASVVSISPRVHAHPGLMADLMPCMSIHADARLVIRL